MYRFILYNDSDMNAMNSGGMEYMQKVRRFFIYFLITIAIIAAIFFLYIQNNKDSVLKPVRGTLDLKSWDERDGLPGMAGNWEFYWNQLRTYDDFIRHPDMKFALKPVPETWDAYAAGKEKLPGFGYATYRLKIIVNEAGKRLSLRINTMSTAYRLFVDDKEIASNGIVGTDAASTSPGYQPVVVDFAAPANEFNIIVQISNFTYARGGFWYDINLGTPKQIDTLNDMIVYKDAVLIGSLLIMALYYTAFFFRLKREKSSGYFVLLCVVFMARTALYGDMLINKIFPGITFGFTVFLTYTSLFWISVVIYLLIDSIFPSPVKQLRKIFITYGMAATVLTALLPVDIYTSLITPIEVIGIAIVLLAVYMVARAFAARRKHAGLILGAICFTLAAGIHDVLYQANVISNPFGELASIGIFIFMFTFSIIMASRFAGALDESKRLSAELADSLEKEKELTATLVKYDKSKDEFLINTSHELKTPLHGVLNITQHVMDHLEESDAASQREDLSYVVMTAKRLSSLIDDIIDFQSIKLNSLRLEIKRVDISAPLRLVLDVLGRLFAAKHIAVHNTVPANRFYVTGDEDRIRQIIYNLVGNAQKYTDAGKLEISAKMTQDEVVITFTDTGIGIEADERDEIFNFFEYAGGRRYTGSSGLGLPIAKKLAEHMGGRLWLEKSKPKEGSVFAFSLPADRSQPSENTQNADLYYTMRGLEKAPVQQDASGKYSVLVVDDDVTNLKVITDIFSRENYTIHTAFTGEKALEIITKNPDIALVLLDVMMPGMSGIEVCRKIRENYSLFDLPVLMLTVANAPEDIAAGLDAGANDYLTKPFEAREMKARVKTLFHLKEAVRDLVTSEMSFLKAQIKPHFIYNALSVIAALITEEPATAKRLLFDLTDYLRGSFHFENYYGLVPLADELETVRAYLSIEKARFRDKLQIKYDIDKDIDTLIPLLFIQPLVENAVRHGIMKKESGGEVRLCIHREGNDIVISVADNGAGVEADRIAKLFTRQGRKKGVGLANINRRLHLYYGRELIFESTIGAGTKVTMIIPERRCVDNESNTGG
jgi:signal transduction histidine kinase